MGVTNIRYLLSQWRLHWETLSALHQIDRPEPDPSRIATGASPKREADPAPTSPKPELEDR